jgi:hypothetical protein
MLLLLQLLLQLLLVLPHRWPAVASPPPPRPPAAAAAAAAAAELAPVANFSARRGHYSYAWDVVEHNTTRYMFYCGNHDGDFVIRDSVMYRKGAKQPDGRWVFGEERLALPHGGPDSHRDPLPPRGCANEPWPGGACVWDKQHACDPDVVAAAGWPAAGFGHEGTQYQFALFYLGIHQDSASGPGFPPGRPFQPVEANHIGVAVAQSLDGPWHKRNGPLIIGDEWWGVGQASAMAVGNATQVLLTYTRGNGSAWNGQMRTVLDLRDLSRPLTVEPERAITEKGLRLADGSPGSGGFVNAAMLFDPFNARFWTLREGKPMPHSNTGGPDFCFVSGSVQLAWIPAAAILPSIAADAAVTTVKLDASEYEWTVVDTAASISPSESNRTHNPGFVSSTLGYRLSPSVLEGMVTGMGEEGPQCLWSYRPFAATWQQP